MAQECKESEVALLDQKAMTSKMYQICLTNDCGRTDVCVLVNVLRADDWRVKCLLAHFFKLNDSKVQGHTFAQIYRDQSPFEVEKEWVVPLQTMLTAGGLKEAFGIAPRAKGDDTCSWYERAFEAMTTAIDRRKCFQKGRRKFLEEVLVDFRAVQLPRRESHDSSADDEKKQELEDALLEELIDATKWMHKLTGDDEIDPFSNLDSLRSFLNLFGDGKKLCSLLRAILHKPAIDEKDSESMFLTIGECCKTVIDVDAQFVIDKETLDAAPDIIVACTYLLCSIYALFIAISSKQVKVQAGISKWPAVFSLNSAKWPKQPLKCKRITNETVNNKLIYLESFVKAVSASRENAEYTYFGGVEAGVPHGSGRLVFEGGEYTGQFSAGRAHGWGMLITTLADEKSSVVHVGRWKKGGAIQVW